MKISIKQANILVVIVLMIFTTIFVTLLILDIFHEYEYKIAQSTIESIGEKSQSLKSILIRTTLSVATLSFIIFGIFLALNTLFNSLLEQDIKKFLKFFKDSTTNDIEINEQEIFFEDFKKMVSYVNEMVKKINQQKYTLMDLNENLELKVKNKTHKLQIEKNFSQELLAKQKEFLRYTVHETNTPLSVILTSLELHLMEHQKTRHLAKIEAATKNIFNLYDDLSYLIKKDHIEYKKSTINFSDFLVSRVDFFNEVAILNGLRLNLDLLDEETFISINESKLQRVVDNTLNNAIKYTLANEDIIIKLYTKLGYINFIVASKSKSIQDIKRLFDEFYREEEKIEGFGLGLNLVKNICKEEDIQIDVSSNDKLTAFAYKFKALS